MTSSTLALLVLLATSGQVRSGTAIRADEIEYQQEAFRTWWGQDLAVKLDDLPKEGKVPDFRIPYAGHDYPDRGGGTIGAMAKYDRAFHRGRMLAADYEHEDVSAHRNGHREEVEYRRGLFGRMRAVRTRGPTVPTWYGHCNGWTSAAIRHAEPQKSVVRNGVVFTPADIKGLLADLYMYSPTEFLGGMDDAINPAMLHVTLGNWVGLGSHPIGVEAALGEVVINYPVYAYKSSVNRLSPRQAEVRNVITYRVNSPREYDKSPNFSKTLYFHYVLDLNEEEEIVGGRYYGDSARIDMLWTALKPVQGGEKGNERGNPHLDTKSVLAMWRESVPEELRDDWLNVDPTEEDRVLPPEPATPAAEAIASEALPEPKPATAPTPEVAPATDAPVAALAAPAGNDPVAAPSEADSVEADSVEAAPAEADTAIPPPPPPLTP